MDGPRSRRNFLCLTAGAAAATVGVACSGSDDRKKAAAERAKKSAAGADRTLRIVQWSHYVPAYDTWFDNEYTKRWGEENDAEVVVDHIPFAEVAARADAVVASKRGYDIFGFVDPPPVYEDEVIDHREIVEELEARYGKMTSLVERSVFNPKTKKYFGAPDYWVANPVHYRVDLWDQVEPGLMPTTWDNLIRAGPKLKAMGFPLGIGISFDGDSNYSLLSLLHAYGASVQDEDGRVAINSPATVEAVKTAATIYGTGMTEDVFVWEGFSNNRVLTAGQASLILNAVSAIRAAEAQDPGLAAKIALAPVPTAGAGAGGPRGIYVTGVNVIWKFSPRQDLAKQFLIDLASQQREAFVRSGFYNLPSFPGAIPDLTELVANDSKATPPDKYALLGEAEQWSTNIGHPGHANAAVDEVFSQFIVPKMFAAAARGEMSAEDAVKTAETEMKPIFDKWKERGKI